MEIEKWKTALRRVISGEKTVKLLVIFGLCGVALIYLSTLFGGKGKESAPAGEPRTATAREYGESLERELAGVVRAITGEESPTVLVTLKDNGRRVYAADETFTSRKTETETDEEWEREHVLMKGNDGAQQALTVRELQPEIKGVVIVSRYAGDPAVREKLTNAARTALDVSSARVCVTDTG